MGKIKLIIQREYLSRVRKKSFIIMTLLGPILMVAMIAGIVWIGKQEKVFQNIMVVEQNGPVFNDWVDTENFAFEHMGVMSLEDAKKVLSNSEYTSLLYIPEEILTNNSPMFYYKKQPSFTTQKSIENQVERLIEDEKLKYYDIDKKIYKKIKENFRLTMTKLTESGEEEEAQNEKVIIGFVFGLMVYMFIFFYGVQVMRGVIEEKTNRIVEVVITSVRPFQLMLGKIIGIALVALTQFIVISALSATLFSTVTPFLMQDRLNEMQALNTQQTTEMLDQQSDQIAKLAKKPGLGDIAHPDHVLNRVNWPLMLGTFLFYFLGGYLLYAALFAAVGSAVDSETDTQQFMLPITLPLIAAYILSTMMIENPDGEAAFWGSLIPFTSPIIMPMRMAMGMEGQGWQLILSMVLLVLTFVGTTWLAGKIYRTGILMYGKKVNYKEIWKWIRFNS